MKIISEKGKLNVFEATCSIWLEEKVIDIFIGISVSAFPSSTYRHQGNLASDAVPVTTEDPAPQTQNPKESFQHQDTDIQIKLKPNNVTSELSRESLIISEQTRDANVGALSTLKGNGATVQVLKKPGGAFGALLGNPASKRKLGLDKKVMLELW